MWRAVIDWVTAKLPLVHSPLNGGHLLRTCPAGEVVFDVPLSQSVQGSFASTFMVSSEGSAGEGKAEFLRIDGNPAKFLQGHNLFGSDDLLLLVLAVFDRLCDMLGLQPTAEERQRIAQGDYRITRVDVTRMRELRSRADVRAFIRAAEFKAKTRFGRPVMRGGTIYFNPYSSFWSMKFYCKADELDDRGHRLPDDMPHADKLKAWVENKLRTEATFRAKFLKRYDYNTAAQLTPTVLNKLFDDALERIDMSEQLTLTSEETMKLPLNVQGAYELWKSGHDLRAMFPKPTFYRYRKTLKEHGIDIAIARDTSLSANVVPMIRYLKAEPASIPDWAFELGLVHESAKQGRAA